MSIANPICYVALFLVSFYYSLKEGDNVAMNEELRKIYAGIVELKNEFSYMSNEEIKEKLTKMQSDFLDIYNYKKDGDDNGDDKNMGD